MKKLTILFTLSLGMLVSYAQDAPTPLFEKKAGGGFVKKSGNAEERVQTFVKKGGEAGTPSDARQGQDVENKTPSCEENHTGEVLFFNNTNKSITLEITPSEGGTEKASVILAKNQSSFISDLGVGSYKYKAPNAKKYKKHATVTIKQCLMKIVQLN